MKNIEFANALREIAAFYEANPEAVHPFPKMYIHCYEREQFINAATQLAHGGMVRKWADNPGGICDEYHAERDFAGVVVTASISRKAVCRLVSPAVYDCPDSLLEEAAEYAAKE